MNTLKLDTWLPLYRRICDDFGFDPRKDTESAELLAGILGDRSTKGLDRVRARVPETVLLCGGSPALADELSVLRVDGYVACADSATTVLSEAGMRIDMIVTDLDGIVEDQIEQNTRGAVMFVHAHGDNIRAVQKYANSFSGDVVGTCQCPPPANLFNFGGFTDGDRAACICSELGARRIVLAGFDFENPSDKPGKRREIKKRKLGWAKVILDQLASDGLRLVPANESEFLV